MFKKILLFLLVCLLTISLTGCLDRRHLPTIDDPTDITEPGDSGDPADPGGETKIDVLDSVELYSSSYRKATEETAQTYSYSVAPAASTDSVYLQEGEMFYIDITLIDLFNSVEFIYTVSINGVKYRFADGDITNTERNSDEKTVSFSVLLEYDGETEVYEIDNIIIQNNLFVSYYVAISDEYKPVVIPTREGDGTKEMLLEMDDYPAGTYFRQANDINLSTVDTGEKVQGGQSTPLDRWKPLGDFYNPFTCNFDGNGFKITRLSIQRFDFQYQDQPFGLFGCAVNCEIKNVTLEDYRVEVRYASTVGALVGYAQNCNIINCELVQGAKENFASGSWSFSNMGGLVGFANESH